MLTLSHEPRNEAGIFRPGAHGLVLDVLLVLSVVTAAGFTAAAATRRILQQPLPLLLSLFQASGHSCSSVLPFIAGCLLGNLPLFVIISPRKDAVGFSTSRFLLQPIPSIPVGEETSSPRSVFDGFFLQYCHLRLCFDSTNSNVGKHQIAKERPIEVFASMWISLYAICFLNLERRIARGPLGIRLAFTHQMVNFPCHMGWFPFCVCLSSSLTHSNQIT